MRTKGLLLIFAFFIVPVFSYSQDLKITSPKLYFDGHQLRINYDLTGDSRSNQFFVWVEVEKKNGVIVKLKTLSGDFGDNIKPGTGKMITWIPEKDSVFMNDDVYVEVKAEEYVKFNKGSMILLSTFVPGLGQSKMSGKPYWLTSIAAYGAMAGGLMTHSKYQNTLKLYRSEEDPVKRKQFFDKAQSQMNMSGILIVSGAAIWIGNMIWVSAMPNRYKPLKHLSLTMEKPYGPFTGPTLVAMKFNF